MDDRRNRCFPPNLRTCCLPSIGLVLNTCMHTTMAHRHTRSTNSRVRFVCTCLALAALTAAVPEVRIRLHFSACSAEPVSSREVTIFVLCTQATAMQPAKGPGSTEGMSTATRSETFALLLMTIDSLHAESLDLPCWALHPCRTVPTWHIYGVWTFTGWV